MSQQSETKFKIKFMKKLALIPNSWWVKIQQVVIRGTPDIIGCVNGKFIALELKKDDKAHIDALQSHNLMRIHYTAKGHAHVIFPSNADEILQLLKEISK